MYDWIVSNGYHPIIIATKMDKLNRSQIPKHVKMVREGLGMEKDGVIIPFSAETKQGRDEIWDFIEREIEKIEAEHGVSDAADEEKN
jgi:GTP-binding protein